MKNSDNKYYQPKIEEFHVGFEYEESDDLYNDFDYENPIFEKMICDENLEIQHIILDRIRVKHLDREDIESFGFEFTHEDIDLCFFEKRKYELGHLLKDRNRWNIRLEKKYHGIWIQQGIHTRFFGTIKNKSELKRLLIQLGIL